MLRIKKRTAPFAVDGTGITGAERPHVGPDDPAALAIRASLDEGIHWLQQNAVGALRGDVEGVHQLRATTRRLRTALDLFSGLIEPEWADALADELKWLADLLGTVRDLDVLTERFQKAAQAGDWSLALLPLFATFEARHDLAQDALRQALNSERYQALNTRLADSLVTLPLTDDASEPCRTALPARVDQVWKRLRKVGRALTIDDPDDHFHEVRKRAKRGRYAAEAVADFLDHDVASDAARFARRARRVQDILGTHQDAVIAVAEIRKSAEIHPDLGPFNFAAGQLLEREQRAADTSRAAFFEVWNHLDHKRIRRWLKP